MWFVWDIFFKYVSPDSQISGPNFRPWTVRALLDQSIDDA